MTYFGRLMNGDQQGFFGGFTTEEGTARGIVLMW